MEAVVQPRIAWTSTVHWIRSGSASVKIREQSTWTVSTRGQGAHRSGHSPAAARPQHKSCTLAPTSLRAYIHHGMPDFPWNIGEKICAQYLAYVHRAVLSFRWATAVCAAGFFSRASRAKFKCNCQCPNIQVLCNYVLWYIELMWCTCAHDMCNLIVCWGSLARKMRQDGMIQDPDLEPKTCSVAVWH